MRNWTLSPLHILWSKSDRTLKQLQRLLVFESRRFFCSVELWHSIGFFLLLQTARSTTASPAATSRRARVPTNRTSFILSVFRYTRKIECISIFSKLRVFVSEKFIRVQWPELISFRVVPKFSSFRFSWDINLERELNKQHKKLPNLSHW